tara:strand:+ start:1569 stop:2231 length:663 start_codon:yes stop_codon:yes gene_type:complete
MAISKFNYNSFNVTPVAGKTLSFNSDADGFTTQSSSSMVLIKTLTASSSGTLSFVDGASSVVLDNTYPVYMFKFINIHPATNNQDFTFNMSADTGSNYNVTKTTTAFYAYHKEDDSEANLAYTAGEDLAQGTGFQPLNSNLGNGNDECFSGTLTLFNPSSTTFVKHFINNTSSYDQDDYAVQWHFAGYGNTTSAVDAVQFKMSSGNIDSGTIKLYGIKDS